MTNKMNKYTPKNIDLFHIIEATKMGFWADIPPTDQQMYLHIGGRKRIYTKISSYGKEILNRNPRYPTDRRITYVEVRKRIYTKISKPRQRDFKQKSRSPTDKCICTSD